MCLLHDDAVDDGDRLVDFGEVVAVRDHQRVGRCAGVGVRRRLGGLEVASR